MTTRTRSIVSWTPAIILGFFMIVASAAPKFFVQDGTSTADFMKALGAWDHRYVIGALEILAAVLFLIPRTTTLGFFALVGVLGGAMATGITHDVEGNWPWFPLLLIGIAMIGAYVRSPELLSRFRNPKKAPRPGKAARIVSWILAVLLTLATLASGIMEFFPVTNPETLAFIERLGIADILIELGVAKIIIALLFVWPRTSVIGLVLMTGYYSGALATNLTRGFTFAEYAMLLVFLALIALTGWLRHPELRHRLLGRKVRV